MALLEAHYHPFLFAMMTLSGIAELGLTSFLISAGNENGTWPSPRYHSMLIMFCFNAAWTTLFSTTYILWYVDGASHVLANVASSVIWLVITSTLWGSCCWNHAQYAHWGELCSPSDNIKVSTVVDSGGVGLDRVWVMRVDIDGHLRMGIFKQMEETRV